MNAADCPVIAFSPRAPQSQTNLCSEKAGKWQSAPFSRASEPSPNRRDEMNPNRILISTPVLLRPACAWLWWVRSSWLALQRNAPGEGPTCEGLWHLETMFDGSNAEEQQQVSPNIRSSLRPIHPGQAEPFTAVSVPSDSSLFVFLCWLASSGRKWVHVWLCAEQLSIHFVLFRFFYCSSRESCPILLCASALILRKQQWKKSNVLVTFVPWGKVWRLSKEWME